MTKPKRSPILDRQSLAGSMLGCILVLTTLPAAAAPHECALSPGENLDRPTKSELHNKFCVSVFTLAIVSEEMDTIRSILDRKGFIDSNPKRSSELLGRGIRALAERDLCLATAQKVKSAYQTRFREEPKCGSARP